MNCNVIRDLLPLEADGCLSAESKALIEEHIKTCESCRRERGEIKALFGEDKQPEIEPKPSGFQSAFERVNIFRASLIQSAALYLSFALIVFGVWREASTPAGSLNGLWGISFVVPCTAFLLSLGNLCFVRFYPSKKAFSSCTLLIYLALLVVCVVWAALHYGQAMRNLFSSSALSIVLPIVGIILAAALAVLSKLMSAKYAALLGKQ